MLSSSIAWAMDRHVLAHDHGITSLTISINTSIDSHKSGEDKPDQNSVLLPCGHCCHATAHYLGLPTESHLSFIRFTPTLQGLEHQAYLSHALEPPFQPPKV